MARSYSTRQGGGGATTATAPTGRVPAAVGIAPQYPDPFDLAKLIPGINTAMPGIQSVASGINSFQSGELLTQMKDLFPTLTASLKQAGENIYDKLRGMVPLDVQHELQGNTAARSLMQGVPGSPFAGNEFGQALGMTSLDLQGKGLQELEGLTGNVRQNLTVNPYDISQNVPNVTDLYNVHASQAVANSAEQRRLEDLRIMREFYGDLGGSGGGGGGVTYSGGGGGGGLQPSRSAITYPNMQTPFTGSTDVPGFDRGGDRSLPWGAPAPYGNRPGVNPWTGLPIDQVRAGNMYMDQGQGPGEIYPGGYPASLSAGGAGGFGPAGGSGGAAGPFAGAGGVPFSFDGGMDFFGPMWDGG